MTTMEQKSDPHFRQTPYAKAAIVLVSIVREQTDCRMGAIMGVPGCGKTEISKNIAEVFQATRLCAYTGIGQRKLVQDLASAMGHANPATGNMDAIKRLLVAC